MISFDKNTVGLLRPYTMKITITADYDDNSFFYYKFHEQPKIIPIDVEFYIMEADKVNKCYFPYKLIEKCTFLKELVDQNRMTETANLLIDIPLDQFKTIINILGNGMYDELPQMKILLLLEKWGVDEKILHAYGEYYSKVIEHDTKILIFDLIVKIDNFVSERRHVHMCKKWRFVQEAPPDKIFSLIKDIQHYFDVKHPKSVQIVLENDNYYGIIKCLLSER